MRRVLVTLAVLIPVVVLAPSAKAARSPAAAHVAQRPAGHEHPRQLRRHRLPGRPRLRHRLGHRASPCSTSATPRRPMPVGALPLAALRERGRRPVRRHAPHHQRPRRGRLGGVLHVIDVAEPTVPTLAATPAARPHRRGPRPRPHRQLRHRRLHAGVGRRRRRRRGDRPQRPGAPRVARLVHVAARPTGPEPRRAGGVRRHPRHRARQHGHVWSVGGGGIAGYRLTEQPAQAARSSRRRARRASTSDFDGDDLAVQRLHHAQLPAGSGNMLLVTEEDYVDTAARSQPGSCNGQGKFETWRIASGPGSMQPARHVADRAQRLRRRRRRRRLEGAGDRQLLVALVRLPRRRRRRRLVRAGRALPRRAQPRRHPPDRLLPAGRRRDVGGVLGARRQGPRLHRRRHPRHRRPAHRQRRRRRRAPTVAAPILDEWFGAVGAASGVPGYRPTTSFVLGLRAPQPLTG